MFVFVKNIGVVDDFNLKGKRRWKRKRIGRRSGRERKREEEVGRDGKGQRERGREEKEKVETKRGDGQREEKRVERERDTNGLLSAACAKARASTRSNGVTERQGGFCSSLRPSRFNEL